MFPVKLSTQVEDHDDALTGGGDGGRRHDLRRGGPAGTSGRRVQQMKKQHNQYRSGPGRAAGRGGHAQEQRPPMTKALSTSAANRRFSSEAPWIGEYNGQSMSLSSLRNTKTSSSRRLQGNVGSGGSSGSLNKDNDELKRKMSVLNEECGPVALVEKEDDVDDDSKEQEREVKTPSSIRKSLDSRSFHSARSQALQHQLESAMREQQSEQGSKDSKVRSFHDSKEFAEDGGDNSTNNNGAVILAEIQTEAEVETDWEDSHDPSSTRKSTNTPPTEDLSGFPVEEDYCLPLNDVEDDSSAAEDTDCLMPLTGGRPSSYRTVPTIEDDDDEEGDDNFGVPRELRTPQRLSVLDHSGHSVGDISCLSVEGVSDDDEGGNIPGFSKGPRQGRSKSRERISYQERRSKRTSSSRDQDFNENEPGSSYAAIQAASKNNEVDSRRHSRGGAGGGSSGGFIDGIPIDAYDCGSNDIDNDEEEYIERDHFGNGHNHKKMKVKKSVVSRRPTLAHLVDSVTAKAGPTINRARRAIATSTISDGNAVAGYGPSDNRYGPTANPYEPDPIENDVRGAVGWHYGRVQDLEEGKEAGDHKDSDFNSDRERRRSTAADVMAFLSRLGDDSGIGKAASNARKSFLGGSSMASKGRRSGDIGSSIRSNRSASSTGREINETPEERAARRRSTAEALENFLEILDAGILGEVDENDAVSLMDTIENLHEEEMEDIQKKEGNGSVKQKEEKSHATTDDKSCSGRSVTFAVEKAIEAEIQPEPAQNSSKKARRRSTADALEAFLGVIESGALGYVDDLDVQSLANQIDEIRQGEEGEDGDSEGGDMEQPTERRVNRRYVARRRSTIELLEKAKARARVHKEKQAAKAKSSNKHEVEPDDRRGSTFSTSSNLLAMIGGKLDEEEAMSLMDQSDDDEGARGRNTSREPANRRVSLDHVRALVQHVLNGQSSRGRFPDEEIDAASRQEDALNEVKRRYTLYLLDEAKRRVDMQEEVDSKKGRQSLSHLGLGNGLFGDDEESLMGHDDKRSGWDWYGIKFDERTFCGLKPIIFLAAVALVLILIPMVSWIKCDSRVNRWTFEDNIPLQPYDALNPADAYESAHNNLEQILVDIDDDDEEAFQAIMEEARNVHLKFPKPAGGSIYAIESSKIGKKLLESLPNTRVLDKDYTIQAVIDDEEDEHLRQLSGHSLSHHEEVGFGYAEIWEGCEPPAPSTKIGVCVADTGVACGHPDLPPRSDISGEDMIVDGGERRYEYCNDRNGHGTHMAGVIAALSGNGQGIIGAAAKAAKLIATRALRDDKLGSFGTMMDAIEGCKRQGAKIIVLSLGCQDCYSGIVHDYLRSIIENDDISIVASAGNFGSSEPFYPASFKEVISVTATNRNGGKWGLSNYGDQIELGCLGYSVLSTDIVKETDQYGNEVVRHTYGARSGTSMAAPCVAAALAAVRGVHPYCTNQEIRNVLALTAKHPNGKCDAEFGFGVVQPCKAIEHIKEYGCERNEGNWILSDDDKVCSTAETFTFKGKPSHTPGAGHHPGQDAAADGMSPENPNSAFEEELNEFKQEIDELKDVIEHKKTRACRDHPRKSVKLPTVLRPKPKGRKRERKGRGKRSRGKCSWIAKQVASKFPDIEKRDQVLEEWCTPRIVYSVCKETCRKCPQSS